jgi:endonuclease G
MPSADRTRTQDDNSSSFLMTNMIPQAADNNRGTWRELEEYARELAEQGKELYLVAGGYGNVGTIGRGEKITVPTNTWKVIAVLDRPGQGIADITPQTRVIAVDMPNTNDINSDWRSYRTTVDAIEAATGYDFLANVPEATQAVLEAQQDNL